MKGKVSLEHQTSLSNIIDVKGVFIGFFILIAGFKGTGFIFIETYRYVSRDIMPILYESAVVSALLFANMYMLYKYKFFPVLIRTNVKESLLVAVGGIISLWFAFLIFLISLFKRGPYNSLIEELITLPSPYFYIGMLIIVGLGPLFEEMLMRGYFFEILRKRWNVGVALMITLLFAAISHFKLKVGIELIPLIIYNIIFTLLYLEGGLLASTLAHMFVNIYTIYILHA